MRRVSLHAPEAFHSLASTLLGNRIPRWAETNVDAAHAGEPESSDACEHASDENAQANEATLREVRLFRARLTEAVETAAETLVADIAADILARELQLAPVEIEAIVDRALHRYLAEEPLRVRVHPTDASRVSCDVPIVADECIRSGDLFIELRCGGVDASLGLRLAEVLRRVNG